MRKYQPSFLKYFRQTEVKLLVITLTTKLDVTFILTLKKVTCYVTNACATIYLCILNGAKVSYLIRKL